MSWQDYTRPLQTTWDLPAPPVEDWIRAGWFPMETCPDVPVLRPHVLWGPLPTTRRSIKGEIRIALTSLNCYFPEEAFEPYWMPIPKQPVRVRP